MPHEGNCKFCGRTWVSSHHISHKPRGSPKKFAYLDYSLNLVDVCIICHKYIHDHPMTEIDLELKLNLQEILEKMFFKSHYSPYIIQRLLKYNDTQLRGFCKGMMASGAGYRREDIIRRLMNDQLAREIIGEVA
jgi:hypothetical protein